jgi:transposase InsO family protein
MGWTGRAPAPTSRPISFSLPDRHDKKSSRGLGLLGVAWAWRLSWRLPLPTVIPRFACRHSASSGLASGVSGWRPRSFFSSQKTERTERKTYRTRNEARADVFDYIERLYNATRHSTIGYLSPVEFERKV